MDIDALKKLREPFAPHHISKLPKPTRAQTDEVKADFKKGIRCKLCGAWHHPDVVHLDYVGHAALTDRLLDADPGWFWEPLALRDGLPAFDSTGGLWIRLTVAGMSRSARMGIMKLRACWLRRRNRTLSQRSNASRFLSRLRACSVTVKARWPTTTVSFC